MKCIVKDKATLLKLLKNKREKSKLTDIIFDFDGLTNEDNFRYNKKFNKYYFACGCNTGTFFIFISITLILILYCSNLFFTNTSLFNGIIYSIIFIVGFAVLGKFIGLLIAKLKLIFLVNELNKLIKN